MNPVFAWLGTGRCTAANTVSGALGWVSLVAGIILYAYIIRKILRNNTRTRNRKILVILGLTPIYLALLAYVVFAFMLAAACIDR